MMYKVRRNDNPDVVKTVHAVRTTSDGEFQFLFYQDGRRMWEPDDEYAPVECD